VRFYRDHASAMKRLMKKLQLPGPLSEDDRRFPKLTSRPRSCDGQTDLSRQRIRAYSSSISFLDLKADKGNISISEKDRFFCPYVDYII